MADVPEIDTAAIRARAEAARLEVAGLTDGSREWRSYHPAEPEHDSDLVISASLADVEALLLALAHAAADENAIPNAQIQPMFELAVSTLRQVLDAFGQPEGGGSLSIRSNATRALVAQWRRALLALDAGESFYRGNRPPTADVEQLRRELGALVPLVEAARELVGKIDPIGDRSPLAPLAAAVAELDRCGTAHHSSAAASDAVAGTPDEVHPRKGNPGGQARVFAVAKEWLAFAGLNLSWSPADPADMAALRQAAIDAGSGGLSVIAANALSVESLVPELMTAAEHRAMELTAELAKLMRHEIIAEGPAWRNDHREFMADLHHIQHRILRQAAARAYPDLYRLLGGWPDVDGGDHA